MKQDKIKDTLDDVEALIKEGKHDQVKKLLSKAKKVRPGLRARYANLARRANLPQLSIRLLNPVLFPTGFTRVEGTHLEIVEYAAALIKIGATREGMTLLKGLDSPPSDAFLFEAFAHISRWDYQKSIPLLLKYLMNQEPGSYEALVGQVNLAAAYAYEKKPEAAGLFDWLERVLSQKKLGLLLGHLRLLRIKWYLSLGRPKEALKVLAFVEESIGSASQLEKLFLYKASAVAALVGNPSQSSVEEVQNVQRRALELRHWETNRDCDFWLATHGEKKREVFEYLYFGTPYVRYRKKLHAAFDSKYRIPESYVREIGHSETGVLKILDPSQVSSHGFPATGLIHRALEVFSRDFYRPVRIAEVFSELYPEEHYFPTTSPVRVRQIIKRFRETLEELKLPVGIEEKNQNYRLVGKPGCRIWVPLEPISYHAYSPVTEKLAAAFGERDFTVKEALERIDVAEWPLRRAIARSVKEKELKRVGKGTATKYRVIAQLNRDTDSAAS